jgi:hypothetical protein
MADHKNKGRTIMSKALALKDSKSARESGVTPVAHVYPVRVDRYTSFPLSVLRELFPGAGRLSPVLGEDWQRHASCRTINERPGERVFRLAPVPEEFIGQRVAEAIDGLAGSFGEGWRFAIHSEGIAFSLALPDIQCRRRIWALGSTVLRMKDGNSCVLVLRGNEDLPVLVAFWQGTRLDRHDRLLLVRKT